MKINALFIENKANIGKPQFAGYVEKFDDVPELCYYALPNFFTDKKACSEFAKKLRECFDAKGDEEGFFDTIAQARLYSFANTWKIVKNEITIYVMKNLVSLDALKPNSGLNESNYYETGVLEFDDDGECHDKKAIAKVWHDVLKYPNKEDSFVVGDTTYLFCIVLSRSLTNHFWAVYPDCKDPKQAEKKLPEYLTRNRPTNNSIKSEGLSSDDVSKAYKAFDDYLKHEVDLTDEEKKLVADAAKRIWDDIYVAIWDDLGTMPGFKKEEKTTFEKAISYKKHVDKNFKITKDHLESLVDSINHEDVLEIVPREMIDDEHFIVIGFDTAVL